MEADGRVLACIRRNPGCNADFVEAATGYTRRYVARQVAPRLERERLIEKRWRGRGWTYYAKETR